MRRVRVGFICLGAALALIATVLPASALTQSLPEIARTNIYGAHEQERAGTSLADAGDFNGDGFGDLLIGGRGRAYVVLGGVGGDIDLASSERRIELTTAVPDPRNVFVVAGAKDVNGDGSDEMLIGVAQADPLGRKNAGSAFLIFGRGDTATILLDPVPAPGVIRIDGAAQGDRAGTAVGPAGDVDGDSVPDLIVGAPTADDGSGERRGAAYVLFGRTLTQSVDLGSLSAQGYPIHDPDFGRGVGKSVSTAGDVNGDGLDDVIVGAPSSMVIAPPAAYVVFGQATTEPVSLGDLSGDGWMIRAGDKENEEGAGEAVAGGHDVNADGVPDVVVGAPQAAGAFNRGGVVFVIFGKGDGSTVVLDALGDDGFRIEGGERAQDVGRSVGLIPDQDGNGSADVLVGVPHERRGHGEAASLGVMYHLIGQRSTGTIHLWRLGSAGVRYAGEGYEQAGHSVAAITDFHGDGAVDLAAGAPRADDAGRDDTGHVYVFAPVEAPAHDDPPRVELRSYATHQKAKLGPYCWDGRCVDADAALPAADVAGTGNRTHYRLMLPERPDSFSLWAYRELDAQGHPTGEATPLAARLSPVRLYGGATVSSYEAVFRLPERAGDLYLVGKAFWSGADGGHVTWFSHLRLTKQAERTDLKGPPAATLRSDGVRARGALFSYCWSRMFSDGTGSALCADYARMEPLSPRPAEAGAAAFIRIHTRHRPDRVRLSFHRKVSYGYPAGRGRLVHTRIRPHERKGTLRAWDVRFRLPRRTGHLYPLMDATWRQHGTAPYDWHLRLR